MYPDVFLPGELLVVEKGKNLKLQDIGRLGIPYDIFALLSYDMMAPQ